MLNRRKQARAGITRVIELVADAFGITVPDLLSPSRSRHVSRARNLAARIMRDKLDAPLAEIGEALGRHHTTIMHCIELADERVDSDEWTRDIAAVIERRIEVERKKKIESISV